jgi:RIO-like serine/threonine protein kinase
LEKSYIVSISSLTPVVKQGLSLADCLSASYGFDRPFDCVIENNEVFSATNVVRVLPRKRMVAFGVWQGKPAVIKLFFDRKNALRHCKADVNGMKALAVNNIPAPALLYEGRAKEKRVHVLIYERIQQAVSLYDVWRDSPDVNQLEFLLQTVVLEIATQHVLGVLQNDLHLNNFLMTEKQVITLDGAQITTTDSMIQKSESMDNLALFFSQLGAGTQALCQRLFQFYAKARGWLIKKDDFVDMALLIKKHQEQRWVQYEKKLSRSSSAHLKIKTLTMQGMVDRRLQTPEFLAFMKAPDAVFSNPAAVMLKNGRSSTVIRITLDGQPLVIKRYNLKDAWHRVRRMFRVTRAKACWVLAHKLDLFHVETAKPLAYLERRVLGLRGRSYYVTAFVSGVSLGDYCQGKSALDEPVKAVAPRIVHLLNKIKELNLTHGDLKKTNLLIDAQGVPSLIDLDGMKSHATQAGLSLAWRGEVKRFLANFEAQPTIKALFQGLLG